MTQLALSESWHPFDDFTNRYLWRGFILIPRNTRPRKKFESTFKTSSEPVGLLISVRCGINKENLRVVNWSPSSSFLWAGIMWLRFLFFCFVLVSCVFVNSGWHLKIYLEQIGKNFYLPSSSDLANLCEFLMLL